MSDTAVAATTTEATATTTQTTDTSGGFFGGETSTQQTEQPAPSIFGDSVVKDGKFVEGWSEQLQGMGFERLANTGMNTNEPSKFLKRLDDALGLVGKKQAAGLPDSTWDESQVAQFRKDYGIPETPDGYQLKPEQLPQGVHWSDKEASEYAELMHKHHITPDAAKELAELHIKHAQGQTEHALSQFDEQVAALASKSRELYEKEWGGNFAERLESNNNFIRSRFSEDDLKDPIVKGALSHPAIVRIIDEARVGTRAAPLPGQQQGQEANSNSMSFRQQAQDFIAKNPNYHRNPDQVRWVQDMYRRDAAQKTGKR